MSIAVFGEYLLTINTMRAVLFYGTPEIIEGQVFRGYFFKGISAR